MGSYYGPDWLRPYAMAFWNTEDWLNGEWTKQDQEAFDILYGFSVFGYNPVRDNFDRILNAKAWDNYAERNGLDYSDIKDPRKFSSSFGQSQLVTGGLNFVSSNIKRLYG